MALTAYERLKRCRAKRGLVPIMVPAAVREKMQRVQQAYNITYEQIIDDFLNYHLAKLEKQLKKTTTSPAENTPK